MCLWGKDSCQISCRVVPAVEVGVAVEDEIVVVVVFVVVVVVGITCIANGAFGCICILLHRYEGVSENAQSLLT